MDRNELVEKAARAMYEYSPYATWAFEDWDAVDPKDEWRDMATAALDAILSDVIEAVREEAREAVLNSAPTWFKGMHGCREDMYSRGALNYAFAVLGDALKGGK